MVTLEEPPEPDEGEPSAFRFRKSPIVQANRDAAYARLAAIEYRRRDVRADLFPSSWFAEPAWDILLDLFIQTNLGRKTFVSDVCIASRVPPTTALRWLDILIAEGIIDRRTALSDKRLVEIFLTEEGKRRVRQYFADEQAVNA